MIDGGTARPSALAVLRPHRKACVRWGRETRRARCPVSRDLWERDGGTSQRQPNAGDVGSMIGPVRANFILAPASPAPQRISRGPHRASETSVKATQHATPRTVLCLIEPRAVADLAVCEHRRATVAMMSGIPAESCRMLQLRRRIRKLPQAEISF
jgi:hypothetical protein